MYPPLCFGTCRRPVFMTKHAFCCPPLSVPLPFSRRSLDAPTPFTLTCIGCCCSRHFPAASAHPAAVWHRLTRGASGPRRRKRRMRRMTWITDTRMRTRRNLLSRYANAPTCKCYKGCFHEESLWMHASLRDAFCAPRVYAILLTLCEVQSNYPERFRNATLYFARACDTVNSSLPHTQRGKGR